MDIGEIEAIIKLFNESSITKFEFEQDGATLILERQVREVVVQPTAAPGEGAAPSAVQTPSLVLASTSAGGAPAPTESVENEDTSSLVKVESPIVGTFYRKPSPDAEPFVKEGDYVKKGQTLCIVEAMKLMNEIEAPCSGSVEKIILSDSQVVEYGEVLFYLKPDL